MSAEFLDPDLASALGRKVWQIAIADLVRWREAGIAPGYVALNVPSCEILDPDYMPRLMTSLLSAGLSAEQFHLEVDGSMLAEPLLAKEFTHLKTFRQEGFALVIDGLGDGHASERVLQNAPFDYFKIHRTIIGSYNGDPDVEAFIDSLLGLAKKLGYSAMAEGVESREQLAFLKSRGCREVQGYLISPRPRSSATHSLRNATRSVLVTSGQLSTEQKAPLPENFTSETLGCARRHSRDRSYLQGQASDLRLAG